MLIILFSYFSISILMSSLISYFILRSSSLYGFAIRISLRFLILIGLLYLSISIIFVSSLLLFGNSIILIVSQLPSNISSILTIHIFWKIFSTPPLLIYIFYRLPSSALQAMQLKSINLLIFSPIIILCFDFQSKY